jgi:N-acetyl sugar amidotransferase
MPQICKRCIYDETIPGISFDDDGICVYCAQYDLMDKEYPTGDEGNARLLKMASQIKRDGRKKKYDCIVGVSGGCDSSYLLYLTKKLGLRPLAVHFDNTWNSKIAVENIRAVLDKLKIDLFTYVVDGDEYCDIFKSFLKASVPEVDTPSDIGLATTHYLAASKYGIKYILEGHSFRTEGISPPGWFYMDGKYIETIQKKFGLKKIKSFPNLYLSNWLKWIILDGVKKIRPLYYIDYKKEETKKFLVNELGWQWYGGHHMENRTAYFTNNYYLPNKFKIDPRYCEYSALIRSGQMTRREALEKMAVPKQFDENILSEIRKRLSLTESDMEDLMGLPAKSYLDYTTYKKTFEKMRVFFWILYKCDYVTKSFYMKYAS